MCKPDHNLMAYALNEERKCSWGHNSQIAVDDAFKSIVAT